MKGLEPYLYECLAATFHQTYPQNRLTIYFCVPSANDPAFPILQRLIADFPSFDARVFVEDEDPNLLALHGREENLGPNPKIRNMSRAYREAKGDIIWIIDCNVWVSRSVAGHMVDGLCGFTPNNNGRKYKFVHQLPLVVDCWLSSNSPESTTLLSDLPSTVSLTHPSSFLPDGSLLEETFFSTSHAKFYTAISTVAIAPCTVGKSNMFRRSHLNALTSTSTQTPGIDYFSHNICEDHLISDLLWRSPVPSSVFVSASSEGQSPGSTTDSLNNRSQARWGNHFLVPSPPAIQPMSKSTTLASYLARRTRWLRVRKFTVPAATLIEPGTESLLCSFYGAFGLTTLPWCHDSLGIPGTWGAFFAIWAASVVAWMIGDFFLWRLLQSGTTLGEQGEVPAFAIRAKDRGIGKWLWGWMGREVLAGPIWLWAIFGGVTVSWRGRKFWVGMDMKVHEIGGREDVRAERGERSGRIIGNGSGDGSGAAAGAGRPSRSRSKARVD